MSPASITTQSRLLRRRLNSDAAVECADVESRRPQRVRRRVHRPGAAVERAANLRRQRLLAALVVRHGLLAKMPAAAAKVAPGIPHDLVPAGIEIEWVSRGRRPEGGGALGRRTHRRRHAATRDTAAVRAQRCRRRSDDDEPAPTGPMRRYLYEPDDAVVRAHLIGDLARSIDGVLLDATTAYLTSDRLIDDAIRTRIRGARGACRSR